MDTAAGLGWVGHASFGGQRSKVVGDASSGALLAAETPDARAWGRGAPFLPVMMMMLMTGSADQNPHGRCEEIGSATK